MPGRGARALAATAALAVLLGGCQIVSAPTQDTAETPTQQEGGAPGDLLTPADGETPHGASGPPTSGAGTPTPGTGTTPSTPPDGSSSPDPTPTDESRPSLGAPGIPECEVLDLPATALPVIDDIEAGGPYDYPRNDGVRFQNREGILPDEDRDYYREFTVETPGLDHRGARRIVTGGFEETDPDHWYFTGDHYESFCEFDPDLAPEG
ncbi:ribonuclease domain-containing protein [Ornithinimicrobium cavernae]|uniref:ribonuclease domain-containing protein n=1 Tax=Ornithinimicrobium cavernae TaxID=2666047 RepID=UPI000D69C50E|nr:ribonuclease domain-containing protein [Ornithinimicrobium cavernae]